MDNQKPTIEVVYFPNTPINWDNASLSWDNGINWDTSGLSTRVPTLEVN